MTDYDNPMLCENVDEAGPAEVNKRARDCLTIKFEAAYRHHGRLTNGFSGSVLILFPFLRMRPLRQALRCEDRDCEASNMARFQRLNYPRWM